MHRGGNAIFRLAWECVSFLAATFFVGQALFIPSPCEGLPVHLCRGEFVLESRECLSNSKWRNAEIWQLEAAPYCAITNSMGVSLVTLAPRVGVCSMTVPFGHSGEGMKVVFAIFSPPEEMSLSASGNCMPTTQGMM